MIKQAWFCPSCQKHHAPHVETCPGSGTETTRQNPNQPYMPVSVPYQPRYLTGTTYDPCANCKGGACGNAACPKRMYITNAAGGAVQ